MPAGANGRRQMGGEAQFGISLPTDIGQCSAAGSPVGGGA
jgi:hypothetical protein